MSKHACVKAYPKEFREQVVKLAQVGDRPVRELAREFGISVDSVQRWIRGAAGMNGFGELLLALPWQPEKSPYCDRTVRCPASWCHGRYAGPAGLGWRAARPNNRQGATSSKFRKPAT